MEQADLTMNATNSPEEIPVAQVNMNETIKPEDNPTESQKVEQESVTDLKVAAPEAEKAEDVKDNNEEPKIAAADAVVAESVKTEDIVEDALKNKSVSEKKQTEPAVEAAPTATITSPKPQIKKRLTPNIPSSTTVRFGPEPAIVTCEHCQSPTVTVCEPVSGSAFIVGMVVSAVLVPVFGVGCIPGCILLACKPAHDVLHKCPKCLNELGRFKRL